MEGKSLIGKTALVTGAAKRIGRAIALELAAQGANIAAHYRHSAGEAEELRREIESYQVNCWLVQADFAVRTEYESLVDAALDKAGALDILVNSASIFPPSTVHDCTWEDMSASMQINAWAPFYISRSFARKAGRGAIINLLDARIAGLDAN